MRSFRVLFLTLIGLLVLTGCAGGPLEGFTTQFAITTQTPSGGPIRGGSSSGAYGIAAGPDGNLWFTENYGNKIGRITTKGVVTEFSKGITPNSGPYGIAAGPDGKLYLWFTEADANQIGRITPAGMIINEYPLPTTAHGPLGIATGPDSNLWFTEYYSNQIGRMTDGGK